MIKYEIRKVIDVGDWNNLVEETYGKPYNLQQQDGCMERQMIHFKIPSDYYTWDFENDTIPEEINGPEMGVSFKAWLERDPLAWGGEPKDERFLHIFWNRNFYPSLSVIGEDLHKKGLLEEGEYWINIDW